MAPGGDGAYRMVRAVPTVLDASVALCVLALALTLVRRPAAWPAASLAMAASAVAALGATALLGHAAPRALVALQGVPFGVGGTRGTLQVAVSAAILAAIPAASLLRDARRRDARRRDTRRADTMRPTRSVAGAALALVPSVAFVAMFPLTGSLAFAAASITLGAGAGWWARGAADRANDPSSVV